MSEKRRKTIEKEKKFSRRRRIVGAMIRLNRTSDKVFRAYHKGYYPEPYTNYRTKEFFVDFEVLSQLNTSDKNPKGLIYLIGLGWLNNNSEWEFKSFIADDLTLKSEKEMVNKWWETINNIRKQFRAKKAVLYHWSPAEERFLNNFMVRNNLFKLEDDIEDGKYEFRDLMEMFQDAEVVIRGVWGYSLKSVAKGLYEHGLIPEIWGMGEKGNKISTGENTLTTASWCYKTAIRKDINIVNIPEFTNLIKYNHMDCRVMYDLLLFLRKHIYLPVKKITRASSPIVTKTTEEVWCGKRKNDSNYKKKKKKKKKN
jgi:hypothetical protein